MSLRKILVSSVSIFLLLAMVACALASCNGTSNGSKGNETTTKAATNSGDVTVETEENPLFFDKTDFDAEFVALFTNSEIYKRYFFTDALEDSSDLIATALYERDNLIDEYLGVTIRSINGGGLFEIEGKVGTSKMADDDAYQMVLTHNYGSVTGMISNGYLMDLYDFDDINFDASYWNLEAIEAMQVKRSAYLALNDFMISNPVAVFFNKEMYRSYNIQGDIYETVRNGEWTLEKFAEIASVIHSDANSDGQMTKDDIYGFGSQDDYEFVSLAEACDVQWLKVSSGTKILDMSASNRRYLDIYNFVETLADSDWAYLYDYNDQDNSINITEGRFLFTFESLQKAYSHRSSEVKFGILPQPKFDEAQEKYRSYDWSGMLCVPNTIRNEAMVGQTLECLAYFSQETIRPAYYEKLLGTRLADEPDDADMITNYIFENIVLDPVVNFQTKATEPLGVLVYTIPKMMRSKLSKTPIITITTNWESNRRAAQNQVDAFLN